MLEDSQTRIIWPFINRIQKRVDVHDQSLRESGDAHKGEIKKLHERMEVLELRSQKHSSDAQQQDKVAQSKDNTVISVVVAQHQQRVAVPEQPLPSHLCELKNHITALLEMVALLQRRVAVLEKSLKFEGIESVKQRLIIIEQREQNIHHLPINKHHTSDQVSSFEGHLVVVTTLVTSLQQQWHDLQKYFAALHTRLSLVESASTPAYNSAPVLGKRLRSRRKVSNELHNSQLTAATAVSTRVTTFSIRPDIKHTTSAPSFDSYRVGTPVVVTFLPEEETADGIVSRINIRYN